jgi:hypothetical protein
VHEIVRTIELNEVRSRDGSGALRFRIEILRDLSQKSCYRARLLRWDVYRVHPSFGDRQNVESDEEVLVVDEFWDWRSSSEGTADAAVESLLARLRQQVPEVRSE